MFIVYIEDITMVDRFYKPTYKAEGASTLYTLVLVSDQKCLPILAPSTNVSRSVADPVVG